jgi:hypothetical protein
MDAETKQVLIALLEVLKEQSIYLHRQRGWITAVADTLESNAELDSVLKAHPFYRQPPRQDENRNDELLRIIDELILKLKVQ